MGSDLASLTGLLAEVRGKVTELDGLVRRLELSLAIAVATSAGDPPERASEQEQEQVTVHGETAGEILARLGVESKVEMRGALAAAGYGSVVVAPTVFGHPGIELMLPSSDKAPKDFKPLLVVRDPSDLAYVPKQIDMLRSVLPFDRVSILAPEKRSGIETRITGALGGTGLSASQFDFFGFDD